MEFVHNARKLMLHTIKKCAGFPKRYTFYLSQPVAACATRIFENVKAANSIYPANQHEAQIRRDYLIKAGADTQVLVSYIETAWELFGLDSNVVMYWMEMVDTEIRLIKGTIKRDKERYKNLP